MKNLITFTILVLLFSANLVSAQQANRSNGTASLSAPPVDGYSIKTDFNNRKILELKKENVVDVMRIWQEIDLRDNSNAIYASHQDNLMKIIYDAVMEGVLTPYNPDYGDSFEQILPLDQVARRFGGDSTLVEQYDEDGNVISSHFEPASFNPNDIKGFRIKEDWIFNKRHSEFEVRIVGIAPLVTPKTDQFASTGFSAMNQSAPSMDIDAYPAFWIYFPEARHILATKAAPSVSKNSGLSYDDIFIQRLFTSYVVKEERADGERIKDYIADGMGRLYESERIKKALVEFEQKRWSY